MQTLVRKLLLLSLAVLSFIFCLSDLSCQIIEKDPNTPRERIFPYRAWSIAVLSDDRELEERYFNTAKMKAPGYGINTLELHDYLLPGGIVDALIQYDSFPKIYHQDTLTYGKTKVTKKQKEVDLKRFNGMINTSGTDLKVNIWYHVMRDLPEELFKEYPEIRDLNSGFLWKFIDGTLTEFFKKVPEVDRITLISLHETPSILKNLGNMSREEILLKLYLTIYNACHRAGKELIIRDFIDTYEDYQTFWNILDKLPPDVYIMTKSISGDWSHLDMAINPIMNKYKNRKLIVEFDLYGEWSGRGDFPVCYPDYIQRQIREIKALNAIGAVGRLIHDTRPGSQLPFSTIFESPVGINCYAFAKSLSEPLRWLGETDAKWNEDIEAIDKEFWMKWAKERYGEKAAVPVVRTLERTACINKLTFDLAGISFRLYVWYPTLFRTKPGDPTSRGDSWNNFKKQVQIVGIDYLKDEKQRAIDLAEQSLRDIQSIKNDMNEKDRKDLEKLFRGMILIIRSYQAALEGYYQVYIAQSQPNLNGKEDASRSIIGLADEIDQQRGMGWYFNITGEMRKLANEVRAGIVP